MGGVTRSTVVLVSASPEETVRLGVLIGAALRAGDVLALHGDLGAGKTHLVRGLCAGMGLDDRAVASPTFVIMTEYARSRDAGGEGVVESAGAGATGDTPLVHMDAYRLRGGDDLESIGWERVLDGSSAVAIEWAERLGGALPDDDRTAHLGIEATGERVRRLTLHAPMAWTQRAPWRGVVAAARAQQAAVRCPVCGGASGVAVGNGPFCSERCRLADLHRWMSGAYTVSRPLREGDGA